MILQSFSILLRPLMNILRLFYDTITNTHHTKVGDIQIPLRPRDSNVTSTISPKDLATSIKN